VAIEPFSSVSGGHDDPRPVALDTMIEIHYPDAILINAMLIDSSQFDRSSLRLLTPTEWRPRALGDEMLLLRMRVGPVGPSASRDERPEPNR
jgi:hypothetical protein